MLSLVAFLLVGCSASLFKVAENGLISTTNISDEQTELIFDYCKTFPANTEVAIAIIEDKVVRYVGVKITGDSLVSIQNDKKVFEIGSVTKVFTATLLASFAQQGEIDVAEPIQNHLNFEVKGGERITFQQLANHTSGLPRLSPNLDLSVVDIRNPYKDYDQDKLQEVLENSVALQSEPGTSYEYSNFGAGLLGFTLEQRSNSTFEKLLQERVFSKYGMTRSTTLRKTIEGDLVQGLNAKGELTSNWDFNALVGAGGIFSSVHDLAKFAIAHFDEASEELALTRESTFAVNDEVSIGLGWLTIQRKGKALTWHNGGTGGYSASIALDIPNESGIIVLSNVSAYHEDAENIDQLCLELTEMLNGDI
ncbi:serine hydrolase domain-containing protein [Tunicatimonas pelagia]|uniref:serine hydrolase domain-containing protein n=1 Tax=Tunicatimonas pelagia TaxID=931531 RepID=UPI0026652AD4|nr:serine hydrolase domain-containing protein [Tunicatimonas pelagia]WKN42074.1 serine hydrolase [Tunicatimonas pelagia]